MCPFSTKNLKKPRTEITYLSIHRHALPPNAGDDDSAGDDDNAGDGDADAAANAAGYQAFKRKVVVLLATPHAPWPQQWPGLAARFEEDVQAGARFPG